MFGATLPSEVMPAGPAPTVRPMLERVRTVEGSGGLQRTSGRGRARLLSDGDVSRIAELYQEGAVRLRLPAVARGAPPEVVTINTAGGLTGGDRIDLGFALDEGAQAVVTGQACEKIYRSAGGEARIDTRIALGAGSCLDWLAQPMIVFDRARVRRTLDIDMAADARLTAVEGVILGRTAMGEEVGEGLIHDGWRIRRDNRLVHADCFRAGPEVGGSLRRPALLGDVRAFASVLYTALDAEHRLDEARELLAGVSGEAAASAWNGLLLVRFLAPDGHSLVGDLLRFLSRFRGCSMPRQWMC